MVQFNSYTAQYSCTLAWISFIQWQKRVVKDLTQKNKRIIWETSDLLTNVGELLRLLIRCYN